MKKVLTQLEHSHNPRAIYNRLTHDPQANYLRDWIYGGIDGAVTMFAIVAGVVGADLSPNIVLVIGVANLVADGFAMAAGNYSATKAERDDYNRLQAVEHKHITIIPAGEREEIRQIFSGKGFSGEDLERIVAVVTSDEPRWIRTMMAEEYGLTPSRRSPAVAGISTFAAFTLCGLAPLITFLAVSGMAACFTATGITFFGIGAVKSRWSLTSWWRSGLETLAIGVIAAALAFFVGFGLRTISHGTL